MSEANLLSPYGDEPQVQGETCDPASKTCCPCLATRIVRGTVAFLVIGTAAVYGAVSAKPEMAEYLSFLPGMGSGKHECPIAAAMKNTSSCSASCSSSSSGSTSACSSASRAAMLETCSRISASEGAETAPEVVLADTVFEADAAPGPQSVSAE